MNSKIIKIVLSLFAMGILMGLQISHAMPLHLMEGQMMTQHDMPLNDCGSETCVMLPISSTLHQITQIQLTQTKDITAVKLFLLAFLLLILNVSNFKKHHLSYFQIGPPDFKTATVTLRE